VLELDQRVDAGTEVTLVIDYHGVPEPVPTAALGGVEVGWHSGDDGSFVLSEPEGASTWYPVNNHPLDKATYTFRVTVPEPYAAIANGALLGTTPSGDDTTYEWRMEAPMASYLATVLTGEFEEVDGGVHDGVAYSYWYADGIEPSADLERSDRLVAELARRLGPFPFETYGGVVYPPSFINGNGRTQGFLSGVALENQGRSLFAEGTTVPSIILHEAAHQWMGDNVSLTDWSRDIWWVEGFAHFAEYVDDVDALGDEYPEVRASWTPPGNLPVDELFSGGSYESGAMVFYALYREVGEDTFWAILREFNVRYRHANASTDDLIEVASEVSGQDLDGFFQAWLFDETPPPLPR
jgi:aminopeptidase N